VSALMDKIFEEIDALLNVVKDKERVIKHAKSN
jgi:hypothetical protein